MKQLLTGLCIDINGDGAKRFIGFRPGDWVMFMKPFPKPKLMLVFLSVSLF